MNSLHISQFLKKNGWKKLFSTGPGVKLEFSRIYILPNREYPERGRNFQKEVFIVMFIILKMIKL